MKKSLLILFLTFIISCNQGLEPPEIDRTVLTGDVIILNGEFEPETTGLRVASFQVGRDSLQTQDQFYGEILNGNAFLTDNFLEDLDQDSLYFTIEFDGDLIELNYTIAAIEKSNNPFDQVAIGVYGGNETPKKLEIMRGDSVHIKIYVDLDNLPPQPL